MGTQSDKDKQPDQPAKQPDKGDQTEQSSDSTAQSGMMQQWASGADSW